MSNGMYELVANMNAAFGNPKGDPNDINWDRLKSQCENIKDEYNELMDGIEARDLSGPLGVRDALCDIMVFALGAYHFIGLDANTDMEAVVSGVLTRFCQTEEDLLATMRKYDLLGVEYDIEGQFPTKFLRSTKEQQDNKGENYPKGKFLKSVSYSTTQFSPV